MRLLVLGRTGQLARGMAALQGRPGLETTLLGRPDLDLTAPGDLRATFAALAPDAIVNAAAYTAVDRAETEPDAAHAVNAAGAGAAAAAAARLDIPFLHVSTDYVFDGSKAAPYVEDDPTGPQSAYGRSKCAGEAAVAAANPRHLIVRTAWVFSPWGQNFVATMLRLAAERPGLRVVADQVGSPTYAPDLADILVAMARAVVGAAQDDPRFGIYHAVNAGEATWAGFAEAIMAEARRHGLPSAPVQPISTAEYPTPTRRPANSRLDTAKLQRSFGLALPPWQDALARCIAARIATGTAG